MPKTSALNKNGYTNDDIESFAVDEIRRLCQHKLLKPHINDNDKTMSWDGQIEVHKHPAKKKDTLADCISVQVKGINDSFKYNDKKLSYSIDKQDLINYKISLGVLYLVGVTDDDANNIKVYYKGLSLDVIEDLLSQIDKKGTNSISVNMDLLKNNTKDDFYAIVKNFANVISKYKENANIKTIQLSDLKNGEFTDISIKFSGDYNKTTKEFTLNSNFQGWAKDNNGRNVKIDLSNGELSIQEKDNLDIKIDNKVYYTNRKIWLNLNTNKNICKISQNISIENDVLTFTTNNKSTLKDMLYDLNFFFDLVNSKNMKIGETILCFDFDKENLVEQRDLLEMIKDIEKYCNQLEFPFEQLLFEYIDETYEILCKLNNHSNKNNMLYYCDFNGHTYFFISVNNKMLYLFNKKYELYFSNKNYKIPKYSIMTAEQLSMQIISYEVLKIDFNNLFYENLQDDKFWCFINNYMLNCILAFDITNNSSFLNFASYLNCLLNDNTLSNSNKDISFINACQIKNREKINLTDFEIDKLSGIKNKIEDNTFLFSINVLLKNKNEATLDYNKFTKDEIETFSKLPIMKLYEML